MVRDGSRRVMVTLPDELISRLDEACRAESLHRGHVVQLALEVLLDDVVRGYGSLRGCRDLRPGRKPPPSSRPISDTLDIEEWLAAVPSAPNSPGGAAGSAAPPGECRRRRP